MYMKNLYKYLRESLLDDFEDLEISQDNDNIKSIVGSMDKLSALYPNKYPQTFRNEEAQEYSRIDDGILKLCSCRSYNLTTKTIEMLNDLKSIKKFDTIWALNSISFDNRPEVNDIMLAKNIITFHGGIEFGKYTSKVSDLNIKTCVDNNNCSLSVIRSDCFSIEFNNCEIQHNPSKSNTGNYMYMIDKPKFVNCKISGINEIIVYDCLGVRDAGNEGFDNLFDENYKITLNDGVKTSVKRATFRNVCAIINNPKKYSATYFEKEFKEGCIFKVNPKFKLENVIDIKCFNKDLKHIEFVDNNVGILFYKHKYNPNVHISRLILADISTYNTAVLPNNKDWSVAILKRK